MKPKLSFFAYMQNIRCGEKKKLTVQITLNTQSPLEHGDGTLMLLGIFSLAWSGNLVRVEENIASYKYRVILEETCSSL